MPTFYRLDAGSTVIANFRAALDPIRDRLDATMLTEAAVHLIDRADMAGTPRPLKPLVSAWRDWREQQVEAHPDSWEFDPHSAELSVGCDPGTGRTMAILFTGCKEYREAMLALPGVEAYGHQGLDVSEPSERAERKAAWERTIPTGIPSEHMVSHLLRAAGDRSEHRLIYSPASEHLLSAAIPPKAARARTFAIDAVLPMMNIQWDAGSSTAPFMVALRRAQNADLGCVEAVIAERLAEVDVTLLRRSEGDTVPGADNYRQRLRASVTEAAEKNGLNEPLP